jgi:DNA-binding transcriptional MerR regulator
MIGTGTLGPVPDAGLSAGAVSRRLGIAVTTLRTWHQRYGLGPSEHSSGSHRRYTTADMDRLEWMRRLTAQGVPAAEAARVVIAGTGEPPHPARAGGGSAIPVGRAGSQARGMANAAMRLDQAMVRGIAEQSISDHGVAGAWTEVFVPVLIGIGNRHAETQNYVEVEHAISRCVSEALGAVPRPRQAKPPNVLLACAPEEQHSLPLEALAAALAEQGLSCRMLGQRVPEDALLAAVRRTGPAVVVLWSSMPDTGDAAPLRALRALSRRPALILAAGPGWDGHVPAEVLTPKTLGEALEVIAPQA